MIDTYTELKKELSTLNPKITDFEINDATFNLLSLCKLAAQIIEETDDNETSDKQRPHFPTEKKLSF